MTEQITPNPEQNIASPSYVISVDKLSEDLKNDPILKAYDGKTLDDFAREHIKVRKYSDSKVRVPDEKSTPEEIEKFYTRLGRPESPDKYEIPEIKPPEGAEFQRDEKMEKWFRDTAHKANLPQKAFNEIYQQFMDYQLQNFAGAAQQQQAQPKPEEILSQLSQSWGEQTEENLAFTDQMIDKMLPKDLAEKVVNEIKGKPDLIQAIFHFSKHFKEGNIPMTGDSPSMTDVSEINQKINEIRSDPRLVKLPGQSGYDHAYITQANQQLKELYEKRRLSSGQK